MKILYSIFLSFFYLGCNTSTTTFSKKEEDTFVKIIKLSKDYQIAFKDSIANLNYCAPFLITTNDTVEINNNINNSAFCGFTGQFVNSPNGKYSVLERTERGNIDDDENQYHENYFCWLVDLKSNHLVEQYQSACGGDWNEQNEWVTSDGKVVFSP